MFMYACVVLSNRVFLPACCGTCRCANALAAKDPNLQTLVDGFEWTVIGSRVGDQIPGIAQFIQRALNSVNCTFKVQSELELRAQIAQAAKNGGGTCTELGKTLCMDARIMPFAHIIGEYRQKFAGGSDGPMIGFLHAFSLEFGKRHSTWA